MTAATCTQKGTNARECVFCKTATEEETIDATGHNVVVIDGVAPTCTEAGLTEGKHCEACGEVFVAQETVADLGHDYDSIVTAPTCEENGYTTHSCTRCDDSYVDTYTESLGHDWKEATDESFKTCESCGKTEGEKLSGIQTPDNNEENWFSKFLRMISEFFVRLLGFLRNGVN